MHKANWLTLIRRNLGGTGWGGGREGGVDPLTLQWQCRLVKDGSVGGLILQQRTWINQTCQWHATPSIHYLQQQDFRAALRPESQTLLRLRSLLVARTWDARHVNTMTWCGSNLNRAVNQRQSLTPVGWLGVLLRPRLPKAVLGQCRQRAVRVTLVRDVAPFRMKNSWNIRRLTLTD